jgi:hypothetical protein
MIEMECVDEGEEMKGCFGEVVYSFNFFGEDSDNKAIIQKMKRR